MQNIIAHFFAHFRFYMKKPGEHCVQKQISRKKTILLERIALINKIKKVLLQKMKKKEEKDMCALYFMVWLGFIIYIYATSTLVPSGCKSLDDTKDVVLSCSLCQFFFATVQHSGYIHRGISLNVFEQNSWFLNFF